MNSVHDTPVHVHKGKNYLRIFALLFLSSVILFSVYTIKYIGFVLMPVGLLALFGIVSVRFPRIDLYDDGFEIIKEGVINRLTDRYFFSYKEILKIDFYEGYIDWSYLVVLSLFGTGGFGGNSKADRMIITTKDNKRHYYNRFGSRKDFLKTIEFIKTKALN